MKDQMYQDELEQLLQDEVEDHRMYPSDKIWRNIQTEVNGHQSWPALGFISLFIISALTVSTLLSTHPSNKFQKTDNTKNIDDRISPTSAFQPNNIDLKAINPTELTAKTIAEIKIPIEFEQTTFVPTETPVISMKFSTKEPIIKLIEDQSQLTKATNSFIQLQTATVIPITAMQSKLAEEDKLGSLLETPETITKSTTATAVVAPTTVIAPTDMFLKDFAYKSPIHIEKVRNSKFGFGFFVTPSTSYRKLIDDKAKEILGAAPISAPAAINYTTSINNIVRHKPAVGLEFGFAVLYNMTKRLKFKTGVQFNTRQYSIETFQASNDITTISLINNRGVENISVFSPYNNTNGYRATQLDNKMYQVSIPIGFQYDVIQGNKFGITAEASIQPTFTLNKTLYLLSTDYKHYADGNNLMRKWNINSSFGVNLTYKAGAYQWFLGPQARFQHLPTYSNKYPITEYLMDYGIRLGFIKQIK